MVSERAHYYVGSVTLTDVRSFAGRQTLECLGKGYPARWTLLLGANGVGKTTLLQLIALGAAAPIGDNHGFTRLHHDPLQNSDLIRNGAPRCKIRWNLIEGQTLHEVTGPAAASGTVERSGTVSGSAVKGFRVFGYGALRRQGGPGVTSPVSNDLSGSLFDEDVPLRNPEEWLLNTYLVASQETAEGPTWKRYERVRDVLVRALPGVTELRVAAPKPISPSPRAFVEVNGPDGWVPFAALGLGYRTMTAWMVDLASRLFERYPDMKNPLEGAAVCLVDEIDLHLHPQWQRDLIPLLTDLFPQTQFIATAHSPLIVQSAGDANIVVLRREGHHVVIDNSPKSVRNWRLDQILTSELFGVPSARAPELDALQRERDAILGKAELSDLDKKRLAELRSAIGVVPYGDSELDREAMDLVRRVYALHDKP